MRAIVRFYRTALAIFRGRGQKNIVTDLAFFSCRYSEILDYHNVENSNGSEAQAYEAVNGQ